MTYKDKYPNIIKANLTVDDIARMFNYKTSSALRNSSKYHILLAGVNDIIGVVMEQHTNRHDHNIDKMKVFVDELMRKVEELS